ncbi:MAG: AAA family ATPase, partial [Planctomycetaceae bacterium]|nr:AAA family ATPase [Planctomycetaceae bacterium]
MSPRPSSPMFPVKETFLPLPENRLAVAAVEEFFQAPTSRLGRLVFVSGPSGTGKSLLLREFLRQNPSVTRNSDSAILTASEWSAEFAEASQNQTIDAFQEKYRSLELLILEDIAPLSGRRESQTQLQAVLDEILSVGGRVLISSNQPAGSLERFSRRLINRFHGGVSVSIRLPDFDSRVQLLQHFAAARQIPLPTSVAEVLAHALPVSPRELLASLIQLETLARRQKASLTPALTEHYLHQEIMPQPATLSEVAKAVARQFDVPLSGLRGKKRAQGVVLPRQCAMFLARELTDQSLLTIAQFFGRRHHSTVVHACKRMESAL